jgi:hypothetical protein
MSDNHPKQGQKAPYQKPEVRKVLMEPLEALNACCKHSPTGTGCGRNTSNRSCSS